MTKKLPPDTSVGPDNLSAEEYMAAWKREMLAWTLLMFISIVAMIVFAILV